MNHVLAVHTLRSLLYNDSVNNGIRSIGGPFDLISLILPNAYILAGIILFLYLVFGGFMVVTSAGNPQNAQQGQKIIMNAIIGFIIIIASYWIIQLIEALTGIRLLDPTLIIGNPS